MLVEFQDHRAGIPVGQVGHTRAVAEAAQHGEVGVGADVLAQRIGHRVVDGLHRPRSGDVDGLQGARVARARRAHHHRRAVGGGGGVLDQLAAAIDPGAVVGVRLISLQQRELGIVAEVDTLVAKRPAQLEDALHPAHAQSLQVELRCDAQVQVEVVGVDVGAERPGVGAAVDLLQDRGLDLHETLGVQGLPDRAEDVAARADQASRGRTDRQVDVAGPHPGLGIGQALPLVGQRPQAFAEEAPLAHQHRTGAVLADAHLPGGFDQVAQVQAGDVGCRPESGLVDQQLHVTRPVAKLGEGHPAVVPQPQYPARDADGVAVRAGQRLGNGVRRRPAHRVGVDAVVPQLVQLGDADPDLLGQPVAGALCRHKRLGGPGVEYPGVECMRDGGVLAGVLPAPARERQHQEPLGDHRGHPDSRDQPGILVARVPRNPLRLVLHVRSVQRLQLPPAGEEHQQCPPQPGYRPGAQLRALLERRTEHREVQRHPAHTDGVGALHQFADHQLDGAVGGLR